MSARNESAWTHARPAGCLRIPAIAARWVGVLVASAVLASATACTDSDSGPATAGTASAGVGEWSAPADGFCTSLLDSVDVIDTVGLKSWESVWDSGADDASASCTYTGDAPTLATEGAGTAESPGRLAVTIEVVLANDAITTDRYHYFAADPGRVLPIDPVCLKTDPLEGWWEQGQQSECVMRDGTGRDEVVRVYLVEVIRDPGLVAWVSLADGYVPASQRKALVSRGRALAGEITTSIHDHLSAES